MQVVTSKSFSTRERNPYMLFLEAVEKLETCALRPNATECDRARPNAIEPPRARGRRTAALDDD